LKSLELPDQNSNIVYKQLKTRCSHHLRAMLAFDQLAGGRFRLQEYSTTKTCQHRARLAYLKRTELQTLSDQAQYQAARSKTRRHLVALQSRGCRQIRSSMISTLPQPLLNPHFHVGGMECLQWKQNSKDTTDLKHQWTSRSNRWDSA